MLTKYPESRIPKSKSNGHGTWNTLSELLDVECTENLQHGHAIGHRRNMCLRLLTTSVHVENERTLVSIYIYIYILSFSLSLDGQVNNGEDMQGQHSLFSKLERPSQQQQQRNNKFCK
jgi:hypothetical protein